MNNSWFRRYDVSGNTIDVINPLGHTVHMTYNDLGKVTSITDPLGSVTRIIYDEMSNITNIVDSIGRNTSTQYDFLKRLVLVRDALGHETRFAYDSESNLVALTNALGQVYSYAHDAVDQVKTFVYPDKSKECYVYDPNGNMTTLTNRANQVIRSTYDVLNRLNKRTHVHAGDDRVADFDYDAANRLIRATTLLGANVQWAITNRYDRANRLTRQVQGSYEVGFAYDLNSNEKKLTYPGGMIVKYVNNKSNSLSQIQQGTNGVILAKYSRDVAGRVTKRTLANGVETFYQHNAGGYVTNLIVRSTVGGMTNTLMKMAYGFDGVGNRSWVKNKRLFRVSLPRIS